MSWDVDIIINTGIEDSSVEECGNYTYNVSPMYYNSFNLEEGLRGLHQMGCEDAIKHLNIAINKMESDPEKYRAMNPKNGWGDYEGALNFLKRIRKDCTKHPKAKVGVY